MILSLFDNLLFSHSAQGEEQAIYTIFLIYSLICNAQIILSSRDIFSILFLLYRNKTFSFSITIKNVAIMGNNTQLRAPK